jgi:hypothetical protein
MPAAGGHSLINVDLRVLLRSPIVHEATMKIIRTIVAIVTRILCFSVAAQAADSFQRAKPEEVGMSSERLAMISKIISTEVATGQVPGAVLGIVRRDKLVFLEAYGYRDKATGTPMTTDAIFSIASMTKPMVAVGALQLYEQGRLLMDDPLAKYFPKFADMQVAVLDANRESIVEKVPAARKILPSHFGPKLRWQRDDRGSQNVSANEQCVVSDVYRDRVPGSVEHTSSSVPTGHGLGV